MLNWYKKLYVGDNARKKKKQLIRKISMGAGVVDIYLITLASNPRNQLDIFSANELKQRARRKHCPLIIGLCRGYGEALEMTEMLVRKTYEQTGTAQVRQWLEHQIGEESSR